MSLFFFSSFFLFSSSFWLTGRQDDEDANEELYLCVTDPQEVGTGVSAFATYAVSGKSTLPGFPQEINLRRRFADFQWLYEEVLRNSPGYIVPPLPEASVFNKFGEKDVVLILMSKSTHLLL